MLRSCVWAMAAPDMEGAARVDAVRIDTFEVFEWLPNCWRRLRDTVIRSSWPVNAARMEFIIASSPSLISHWA